MIQRIQSLYLLFSIVVCLIIYFLPLGYIDLNGETYRFTACGLFNNNDGYMVHFNVVLSTILSLILIGQFVSIFMYKNRMKQAKLVQISLILIVIFVFVALLYQELIGISIQNELVEQEIGFTWNIILMAISWILTLMALRSIKKDEALVRSADRMR